MCGREFKSQIPFLGPASARQSAGVQKQWLNLQSVAVNTVNLSPTRTDLAVTRDKKSKEGAICYYTKSVDFNLLEILHKDLKWNSETCHDWMQSY